jgi:hypothetical protein
LPRLHVFPEQGANCCFLLHKLVETGSSAVNFFFIRSTSPQGHVEETLCARTHKIEHGARGLGVSRWRAHLSGAWHLFLPLALPRGVARQEPAAKGESAC